MENHIKPKNSFQGALKIELEEYLSVQQLRFPPDETLKMDLHCHDYNSDVPDELLGRILKVPETWLPTKNLLKALKRNGANAFTITNHNNARSCFDMKEQGVDLLVGAEFSCMVPDFEVGIHVLTYGFDKKQEVILNKLRKNLYQFLQYTCSNNIPTIWAHPLYHYSIKGNPPMDFFHKMCIVFERFEVLNGQRDTWQNMLVKSWIESLSPSQIDLYAKKFDVDISLYCKHRYKKSLSAGSDSHMGIFAGQTGTLLHVPNLKERIKKENISDLALEAIRKGKIAPYGTHQNAEKLTVAFLDYVFQIAMYKKDAGMLRVFLHKGSSQDKVIALLITNAFSELKRHKVTMRFVELIHECFMGKAPKRSKRLIVPKAYKPIFDDASKIAKAFEYKDEAMIKQFSDTINDISDKLNTILFDRLGTKINHLIDSGQLKKIQTVDIIERLEIPSEFRTLFGSKEKKWYQRKKKMSTPNLSDFMDGLSFPFLTSTLIMGAHFTSSKVLYNNRSLLADFSQQIGKLHHPKRMLWLADTFNDKNGVSSVLQQMHKEIKRLNLPIDIMVCHSELEADDHLIVVKPMAEFAMPFYHDQPMRIPNLQEVHHLFHKGEYDRVICSTEGPMGAVGLYLKHAYTVPAYFYMHTDWLMFARRVLNLDLPNLDRMRRILRAYYGAFDQLFVLNADHKKWLSSKEMGYDETNIFKTSHWIDSKFSQKNITKKEAINLSNKHQILLYSGRISKEKGVYDIPKIYKKIKDEIPNLKLVFAGTGPEVEKLKHMMPDAIFLGWLTPKKLAEVYSVSDLLILPSKFDTFSCVVLEAFGCGLPVIAYRAKGPKDIIEHNVSGYLAKGKNDMEKYIEAYFNPNTNRSKFIKAALSRAKDYDKNVILKKFMKNVGLDSELVK